MGRKKNETVEERKKRLEYNRRWHRAHREEENRKRMARYYNGGGRDAQLSEYRMMRLEVLERMGGKCVFCARTDESSLTIDHVMDDGAAERRSKNRNVYHRLYGAEEIPFDRYQVLCLICNHKKRIFGPDPNKWPQEKTVHESLTEIKRAICQGQESLTPRTR